MKWDEEKMKNNAILNIKYAENKELGIERSNNTVYTGSTTKPPCGLRPVLQVSTESLLTFQALTSACNLYNIERFSHLGIPHPSA